MFNLPDTAILFASDRHGIFIPQYFAESVHRYKIACWSSWITDLDALCAGPDTCQDYWEIWEDMLNRLELTDDNGVTYSLHQDGDLWLVPTDHDWNEESAT